ncbi:MAG: CvpA family protein [Rhodospirillaceae bacterium]
MQDWPINPVDALALLVLLISALFAFFRGFVHEVLAIAAWLGALVAALYGYPYLQPVFAGFIPANIPLGAEAAAGLSIFLVVLVSLSILVSLVSKQVQKSALNALDRSLGFLFGIARGALFLVIAYVVMTWFLPPGNQPGWMRDARVLPLVEQGAVMVTGLLPQDLRIKSTAPFGGSDGSAGEGSSGSGTQEGDPDQGGFLETDGVSYEDLANPKPTAPNGAGSGDQGYGDAAREALDREINQLSGEKDEPQ